MPVDTGLAALSNNLMTVAIVVYSVAMLAYAAEFALGRGSTYARARTPARTESRVAVGGAGAVSSGPDAGPDTGPDAGTDAGTVDESGAPTPDERSQPARDVGPLLGRVAVALTVVAWAIHLSEIVTRGLAVERWPWGNMYEFSSALAFSAVTAFLVLLYRQRVRFLGLFILIPVVLGLWLAATVLYTSAGPLVPALHSYWIAIHVTAMVVASGAWTAGAAAAVLYLVVDRYERQRAAGRAVGLAGIAHSLPGKDVLDRVLYRTVAFGFPIWTFAVIAGAIWAEAAWGRYWGWDPKETWSFITWVVYACYLHARLTAGWRGRRLAVVALIGFGCFLFNYFGVNIWVSGLHSYAGL